MRKTMTNRATSATALKSAPPIRNTTLCAPLNVATPARPEETTRKSRADGEKQARPAEPGEESGAADLRDVPDLRHGVLRVLADPGGSPDQARAARSVKPDGAVAVESLYVGAELVADDGELRTARS